MKNQTHSCRALALVLGLDLLAAIAGCDGDTTSTSTSGDSSSSSSSAESVSSSSSSSSSGNAGGMGGMGGMGGGNGGMGGSAGTGGAGGSGGGGNVAMSFFVSSTGSATGNLGGLAAADKKCQDLATAVGAGGKTWHAYLSVENGGNGTPVHAKDRIGTGPWYNANLAMIAANLTELHQAIGDHTLFLDEKGAMINGQWAGSPTPNQHDILTGSKRDGTVMPGKTCADWTSADATMTAWIGHCDGLGPMMSSDPMYQPWNSVHENGGCNDTAPRGGAGRIYCFAID
ncbi:MAG TPA: hypothetical protein PK156_20405 [Polyangium sp.]|nr:hypothetical protein [Polyangium sp.]